MIDLCSLFNGNQINLNGRLLCYLSFPLTLKDAKRIGFTVERIEPEKNYTWIIEYLEKREGVIRAKVGNDVIIELKYKDMEVKAEGVGVYLVTFKEGFAVSEEGTCIIKLKDEGVLDKVFLEDDSWIKAFYL